MSAMASRLPSERTFYHGAPQSADAMWRAEQQSIASFCRGRGLDPGAGNRTLRADTLCADLFADVRPDVQCHATALPFRANAFDYVCNAHLLEHLADTRAAICEWLRVVRPGGVVAMIIPDTRWTRGMNTDRTPHLHEWAPGDFCQRVLGWPVDGADWWRSQRPLTWCEASVEALQVACPAWSFSVILRKHAEGTTT